MLFIIDMFSMAVVVIIGEIDKMTRKAHTSVENTGCTLTTRT
jgi:hypothetical protein